MSSAVRRDHDGETEQPICGHRPLATSCPLSLPLSTQKQPPVTVWRGRSIAARLQPEYPDNGLGDQRGAGRNPLLERIPAFSRTLELPSEAEAGGSNPSGRVDRQNQPLRSGMTPVFETDGVPRHRSCWWREAGAPGGHGADLLPRDRRSRAGDAEDDRGSSIAMSREPQVRRLFLGQKRARVGTTSCPWIRALRRRLR
jgi:hypothetical protein